MSSFMESFQHHIDDVAHLRHQRSVGAAKAHGYAGTGGTFENAQSAVVKIVENAIATLQNSAADVQTKYFAAQDLVRIEADAEEYKRLSAAEADKQQNAATEKENLIKTWTQRTSDREANIR